jgi:hypothetical protein
MYHVPLTTRNADVVTNLTWGTQSRLSAQSYDFQYGTGQVKLENIRRKVQTVQVQFSMFHVLLASTLFHHGPFLGNAIPHSTGLFQRPVLPVRERFVFSSSVSSRGLFFFDGAAEGGNATVTLSFGYSEKQSRPGKESARKSLRGKRESAFYIGPTGSPDQSYQSPSD